MTKRFIYRDCPFEEFFFLEFWYMITSEVNEGLKVTEISYTRQRFATCFEVESGHRPDFRDSTVDAE